MMVRLLIVVLCLTGGASFSFAQEDARFFVSIQDVPLMPGLTELTDQVLVFDKPEGRIVESIAQADSLSSETVLGFYNETLPQLGWVKTAGNSYVRQGESLELNFENYEGHGFLRVMVQPLLSNH